MDQWRRFIDALSSYKGLENTPWREGRSYKTAKIAITTELAVMEQRGADTLVFYHHYCAAHHYFHAFTEQRHTDTHILYRRNHDLMELQGILTLIFSHQFNTS